MESSISEKMSAASTPCSSPTVALGGDPNSSPSPPPQTVAPAVVMSPCAACKILRRRCADKCVLAPYFPPTDPIKFTIAHKVFGASNIIKLLQDLPEGQREDAVSSMVYDANARLRDPVYGSAGAICQLQKQVSDLQAELAKARAEIVNMQCQQANLIALICMEMTNTQTQHYEPQQEVINNIMPPSPQQQPYDITTPSNFFNFYDENNNFTSLWEPLWI